MLSRSSNGEHDCLFTTQTRLRTEGITLNIAEIAVHERMWTFGSVAVGEVRKGPPIGRAFPIADQAAYFCTAPDCLLQSAYHLLKRSSCVST